MFIFVWYEHVAYYYCQCYKLLTATITVSSLVINSACLKVIHYIEGLLILMSKLTSYYWSPVYGNNLTLTNVNLYFKIVLFKHRIMTHCQLFFFWKLPVLLMYSSTNTIMYKGLLLSWSYGSWIYNYQCNQCLSSLKLWVWIPFMVRCTRYNILW